MQKLFAGLLIFVPIAYIVTLLPASPITIFICCAIGIIPLAKFLSDATEDLSIRMGPAGGGLLNATFGNATELIIGYYALAAGLTEVVKASIIGSILGNLLFVLGLAIFVGGFRHVEHTFNATAARANASVLLLSATALVIPAIFFLTSSPSLQTTEELSIAVSILMILGYFGSLLFSFYTHKHLYLEDGFEKGNPKWGVTTSTIVLLLSTIGIAFLSDTLVQTIEPVVRGLGWTQLFIGAIVIAIIGNAAEHVSAVVAAVKHQMELAIQISIGSATQILMLVTPLLVLIGAFFPQKMTLVFNTFELAALVFAIFITNSIIEDGETNWFEGAQLLIVYFIIAVAFFLHT